VRVREHQRDFVEAFTAERRAAHFERDAVDAPASDASRLDAQLEADLRRRGEIEHLRMDAHFEHARSDGTEQRERPIGDVARDLTRDISLLVRQEVELAKAELAQKSTDNDIIVAELADAAMALRARGDRLDHSLTFIRDVAARLEGGDRLVASQAALDLAIARTGSRAGVVQLVDARGRLRTVASLGAWTLLRARPPDLLLDRTIKAAFESAAPVRAIDLPDVADVAEAGRDQSDVAAPITDDGGEVRGVLALRGVPADSLSHALVHDIGLIARWCAKANGSRDLAINQTAPATGEPDRRPAPPRAEGIPPSGSQRFN